ncbi:MAG: penicillin acylase family protein [Chloroflexi bacterium]|nr:penicillin acylase family protein [Chloroflexota bacterium]
MRTKLGLLLILVLTLVPISAHVNHVSPVQAQDSATLALPGLDAEVMVYYDSYDTPHIYAQTSHDLFMAQGYIHASERFWQMEWSRRLASGRLAEIEPKYAGQDAFFRTLGLRIAAEQDLAIFDADALSALQAYSDGVNAYLDGKTPDQVALEYKYLAEKGIEPTIDPWTPLDTVTFGKALTFTFADDFQTEIQRSVIAEGAGALATIALQLFFPQYPADHPIITQPGGVDYTADATSMAVPEGDTPLTFDFSNVHAQLVGNVNMDEIQTVLGHGTTAISNSWTISGSRTDTGAPYLANDPHIGISMPGVWYEQGLHCVEKNADCPYDVVGVVFPGAPGVLIGNNDRIAWGLTVGGADTQDLYTLTLNPDNPLQYQYNGEWKDFDVRTETVNVVGGDPVEVQVRNSVWGPVISEALGFDPVWALRWTTLDPSTIIESILYFDRATNWDEFLTAVSLFDTACQNIVYADVEGNIGYKLSARVPIRAEGHDPRMPVDGSTDQFAWQGFIPFDEMPELFNPEQGYIATANNRVVGDDFPYYLLEVNDYGYRAKRIETLLQNDADGVFTLDELKAIQTDTYNGNADTIIPALQALTFDDPTLTDAVAWLAEWDHYNTVDSPYAALFETVWMELNRLTFSDDFGDFYSSVSPGTPRYWEIFRVLIANKANPIYGTLWDNGDTPNVKETADDIMKAAFTAGYAKMVAEYGNDPTKWRWGTLHITKSIAEPLGYSGDPAVELLFNRGIESPGGGSIVNAIGYTDDSFDTAYIPSQRQLIDFSNFDNSQRILPIGESGNPLSPHYDDQMEMWATGQYRNSWFTREAVEANAQRTLTFTPG